MPKNLCPGNERQNSMARLKNFVLYYNLNTIISIVSLSISYFSLEDKELIN